MAKTAAQPVQTGTSYTTTSKAYNPKAAHNAASWSRLLACLAANGNKATGAQLLTALTYTTQQWATVVKNSKLATTHTNHVKIAQTVNPTTGKPTGKVSGYRQKHKGFVSYLVKGGYLKVVA